jgi:hypothetical protein
LAGNIGNQDDYESGCDDGVDMHDGKEGIGRSLKWCAGIICCCNIDRFNPLISVRGDFYA